MISARCVLLAALFLVVGCQTKTAVDDPATPVPAEASFVFVPAEASSPLHLAEGQYPDLFSSASYALWVGATPRALGALEVDDAGSVLEAPAQSAASPLEAGALTFECHLKSGFADMSIAYDAVGLRGMRVYLETPSGNQVAPLQTIVGQELEEDALGALKIFGRTNRLVFDRRQAGLDAVPRGARGLRLVLEGHDSRFYFEWLPQYVPPPSKEELQDAARERSRETRERWKQKAKSIGSNFH